MSLICSTFIGNKKYYFNHTNGTVFELNLKTIAYIQIRHSEVNQHWGNLDDVLSEADRSEKYLELSFRVFRLCVPFRLAPEALYVQKPKKKNNLRRQEIAGTIWNRVKVEL